MTTTRPSGSALLALAAAFFTALPVGAAAQEPPAQTVFHLPGLVLEIGTDRPVPLAIVEAEEAGRSAVTDSIGRFVLRGLPEGEHTFRVGRLGYVESVEASVVRTGNLLVVRLMPQPVILEGLTVIVNGMERRRNAVGTRSSVLRRDFLATTGARDIAEALRDRHGVMFGDCPNTILPTALCVRERGRSVRVQVWLDEVPMPGSGSILQMYAPHEVERVEYYAGLGQVRLYTAYFLEELARSGRSLTPICIVCG